MCELDENELKGSRHAPRAVRLTFFGIPHGTRSVPTTLHVYLSKSTPNARMAFGGIENLSNKRISP